MSKMEAEIAENEKQMRGLTKQMKRAEQASTTAGKAFRVA
jgi:hypothetical protein